MTCDEHTIVSHVAVLHGGRALLVKYGWAHDDQPGWFLPNDGLNNVEHPEQGAKRILKDHLGISDASLSLFDVESFIGNNKSWHLIFDYVASVPTENYTKSKDVLEAAWFEVDKLPPVEDFAHNGWGRAILLKNKVKGK
jgi:ADP-ribose pyrophosphatase YjhB (NUDIX family)